MSGQPSEASTLGWALRQNGSCLTQEEDCGPTVEPYRVCCPAGSYCPRAYNIVCCPSSLNCTDALQARPVCANSTWDLYYNGGYFCCEHGTKGYATSVESNGCGEPEYELADSETQLSIISAGTVSTSTRTLESTTPTSQSSSSTSTSTWTSISTPASTQTGSSQSDAEASGPNVGAVAGGVMGGVAGAALIVALVWLLFRMRRQKQRSEGMIPATVELEEENPGQYSSHTGNLGVVSTITDRNQPAELDGDYSPAAELPAPFKR
ncbi:hypothetical protein BJX70DRAFT_399202 [Aspergillus crustosus]